MNNTQKQTKLKVATIKLSAIEYQGLFNPETEEHRIGVSQIGELLFPATKQNSTYHVKQALGEDFQLLKYPTELNPNPVNTISLEQFGKVIRYFDRKGNQIAQTIMDVLVNVSLENLHNDAFGIKNTASNNQTIAEKTLQSKYEEIYNNPELNQTQKERECKMLFLEFELEKAKTEKEKEGLHEKLIKEQMEFGKIKSLLQQHATELDLDFNNVDDIAEQVTLFFQTLFKNIDNLKQYEKEWYPVRVFVINKFPNDFSQGQHKVIGKICGQLHQKLEIPQKYKDCEYRSDLLFAVCNAAKEQDKIKMKLVLNCAKKYLDIILEDTEDDLSFIFE